ncbi:hypothetical protein Hypma_006534 [Hypsizygus marmoreus]|uniref:Uncharacterized protein n=1 Tax=Hypsizygus marmoreus TaxID=39966 RepID=A0A369JZ71_HYPMA|nr:hypothetical protein Hypma_006534 [Hypsizygus marmoreus]
MVQKNVALAAAAAFVIGISSVSAAPVAGYDNELYGRAFEEELYARADKIIKAAAQLAKHVAKDQAHSTLVDAATDKAKSATENKQPISPVAAAAVKQMTSPFNPAAVNAVVFPPKKGQSSGQKKTRDLYDDDLSTRDLDEELYARADKIIKAAAQLAKHVAKDQAHSTLVDAATDKAKSATENKQPISPVAAAAVKQMTKPFNPAAVNAVVFPPKKGQSSGQKKTRGLSGLYDEDLFTRDFEELHARADKIIKAAAQLAKHVAKDQAHSTLVDAATDKAKSATENKQPISPVAAAAVKQMTKPFNPAAVNAVVFPPKKGQSSGQKKTRDLSFEEFLEARWFGLEDLD